MSFEGGLVGLHESVKSDPGAAIGECDDGSIADGGILSDQLDQYGRVVDQTPTAAFPVGEVEEAAGDGAVDLFAGFEPNAGDERFAPENLALPWSQGVRGVAALMLQEMPEILISSHPE